jgi:hypothetical protein
MLEPRKGGEAKREIAVVTICQRAFEKALLAPPAAAPSPSSDWLATRSGTSLPCCADA